MKYQNYLKKLGVASNRQIFIPLSGYNGDNLVEKSNNMPWYNGWECSIEKNSEIIKGYTLIDAVDYGLIIPRRAIEKPLRIPILRTYKVNANVNVNVDIRFWQLSLEISIFPVRSAPV